MATEERVLCFERKLLEEPGVFQGLREEDHGIFSSRVGYQDGMRREIMEEVAVDEVKEADVGLINPCYG
jgi:hypothetical protein